VPGATVTPPTDATSSIVPKPSAIRNDGMGRVREPLTVVVRRKAHCTPVASEMKTCPVPPDRGKVRVGDCEPEPGMFVQSAVTVNPVTSAGREGPKPTLMVMGLCGGIVPVNEVDVVVDVDVVDVVVDVVDVVELDVDVVVSAVCARDCEAPIDRIRQRAIAEAARVIVTFPRGRVIVSPYRWRSGNA
jgi:hypothetical protein